MKATTILLTLCALFLLGRAASADDKNDPKDEGYIKVEVKGTLRTGIIAIGGETTGFIIETKDGTLELDLSANKDLRDQAEKLDKKVVTVTGNLTLKKGRERGMRSIVRVDGLRKVE